MFMVICMRFLPGLLRRQIEALEDKRTTSVRARLIRANPDEKTNRYASRLYYPRFLIPLWHMRSIAAIELVSFLLGIGVACAVLFIDDLELAMPLLFALCRSYMVRAISFFRRERFF